MKVTTENIRLIKPLYEDDPPPVSSLGLNMFDWLADDGRIPIIYGYKPPTPPNAALEQGLRKVLSQYRELAGRLCTDQSGHRIILLNDEGARLAEASADCTLDQAELSIPSPALLDLHLSWDGTEELTQIQLTRFTCGSLVVGFSGSHVVADGKSISQFLVAWGRTCRGLDTNPRALHHRTIFVPRYPPRITFQHQGVEFRSKKDHVPYQPQKEYLCMYKAHFTPEFLLRLKSMASSAACAEKPYTTIESLVAHLWRTIARACLPEGHKSSSVTIAVDGRARLTPRVPHDYFGNLVLWAFHRAEVKELLSQPLSHAAKLIHEAVAKVNDEYFKSLIDFARHKVDENDLIPKSGWEPSDTSLNLDVDSWLRFPFNELDFGGGKPVIFMPSYHHWKGQLYIVSSMEGDGSIDVYLTLCQGPTASFKQICYSLN